MHYVLSDLLYRTPWLHCSLAPEIMAWMSRNEIGNADVLADCIYIVLSGDADGRTMAELAQSKILNSAITDQWAVWYALWADLDADRAIPAVEAWLSRFPVEEASVHAQAFITRLMGTRRSYSVWPGHGSFRGARHLRALYVLMSQHIQTKDDIDRANTGVYSPGLRDYAQQGRDALLNQLAEIPGKETYVALTQLAKHHPDVKYRPWMEKLVRQRAEKDADLEYWSARQVREYELNHMSTPATHRQLFDLAVDRLIDLKEELEHGNASPYKTWRRANGENEMRNLVADWLGRASSGYYTCAQENELPNRQRPDIWVQSEHVASPVPIELKLLDQDWSGPALCERLRNQLAGDYLREVAAGCGIMLLIWRGRSNKARWMIGGHAVARQELAEALNAYWHTVADDFPGVVSIKVLLIDLTVRDFKSAT